VELHVEPYQAKTEQTVEKPDVEVKIIIAEEGQDKPNETPNEDEFEKIADTGKANWRSEITTIWDRILFKSP